MSRVGRTPVVLCLYLLLNFQNIYQISPPLGGQQALIKQLGLNVPMSLLCLDMMFCPSLSISLSPPPPFFIFLGLSCSFTRAYSRGSCTFQSAPFCPSEADALNKMTTVICLCHSGPSADLQRGSKIQWWRGRPNMCVGWL